MALGSDLLDQARVLLRQEPIKPKQVSLRRAVSAAYYAHFHLLAGAASRFVVSGTGRAPLRNAVLRTFDHSDMKQAASGFAGGSVSRGLRKAMPSGGTSPELRRIARAVVDLQQARQEADYDVSRTFSRQEATDLVEQAVRAAKDWRAAKGRPDADAFLVALLLQRRLRS